MSAEQFKLAVARLRAVNERLRTGEHRGAPMHLLFPLEQGKEALRRTWGDELRSWQGRARELVASSSTASHVPIIAALEQLQAAGAAGPEWTVILEQPALGRGAISQNEVDRLNASGPFAGRCDFAATFQPIPSSLIDALERAGEGGAGETWITLGKAVGVFRVARSTLQRHINSGNLRHRRRGLKGIYLVPEKDVEAIAERRSRTAR